MKDQSTQNWLVIGGGLIGQLTALSLCQLATQHEKYRQQNIIITHIFAKPPVDPRTTGIMATSVPLFKKLGLWEKLQPSAYPLTHIHLYDGTHNIIRAPEIHFNSQEIGLPAFGYNISNNLMRETMDAQLENFDCYEPKIGAAKHINQLNLSLIHI